MARISTTPEVVFQAIVDLLIANIEDATEDTCYLSLDPDLIRSSSSDFVYVVSPNAACHFDEGLFDGGRLEQVHVTWPVAVTVHTIHNNDYPGEDGEFIGNASYGVMPPITNVAKYFLGADPTNDAGNYILAQPIFPYSGTIDRPTRSQGSMQLYGSVEFTWDLS